MIRAIDEEDVSAISKIPGIGKKTASRLILELAGKLVRPAEVAPAARLATDVELALRGLGYGVTEIRSALEGIKLPDDESAALKLALKYLGEK